MNQTLMRSINTSLIGLLPVAGLLFVGAGVLGVGTIKDLALILFVGLASGVYSSLFLATPIVVDLTERDPKYKALTRRVEAKRASDAKRGESGELVGAGAPARRGGPAPSPNVGARPQRGKRQRRARGQLLYASRTRGRLSERGAEVYVCANAAWPSMPTSAVDTVLSVA